MNRQVHSLRSSVSLFLTLLLAAHVAAPALRAEQFQKVGMVVAGAEKAREEKVILSLEESRMAVLSKEGLNELRVFPYKEIKSAEYSHSKHPRWKSGGAAALAVGVFALPIFFMKSKSHWLTVQTEKDYAVLHLDKNDFRLILTAFETRSGVKVVTVEEEK